MEFQLYCFFWRPTFILDYAFNCVLDLVVALKTQTIRMSVICNWHNEQKYPLKHVQELAGHKWVGIIEKYIKANSEQQRELINRFFPAL